jgi:hypothetical protein
MNPLPFKYQGGDEQFRADLEKVRNTSERSLEEYLHNSQSTDVSRRAVIHTLYLNLGILYSWMGDSARAQSFFAHAADYALDVTHAHLSSHTLPPRAIPDLARIARDGAIAAELGDRRDLVYQLFNAAQFLAAGMLSEEQERPVDITAGLDTMAVYHRCQAQSTTPLTSV